MEIYEEIHVVAQNNSNRRIDIIALDRKSKKGFIIDPTIRFENNRDQNFEVQKEKADIYEPCIPYIQTNYQFNYPIEVIGLFIGARGTITKQVQETFKRLKIPEKLCEEIALATVKGSVSILQNHLFKSSTY